MGEARIFCLEGRGVGMGASQSHLEGHRDGSSKFRSERESMASAGARVYNGGVGGELPVGSRGKALVSGQGAKPPKLTTF